eukprot:m.36048 g.36048  ORF g.36048 m.36048 type:complete len:630 (+) comp12829_c0_seq2:77-1966(+)
MSRRVLKHEAKVVLAVYGTVSVLVTGALVYVLVSRPSLRRRQLSWIILMQAIADCAFGILIMGFMWNSCAVGNKYLFATVTYSSAWVSVLAFHQASQASGRWIEVENYGLRYQLFAAGVTVLLTVLAFGVMDFQSDPCFGDYNGGTVVNDTLMVSLVFSTTVWCAGCLGYTRLWLGVRLYSSRFILIYFACWMPQIVWFVFEWAGAKDSTLESQPWIMFNAMSFMTLGILNAFAYSTMPPEFILKRFAHTMRKQNKSGSLPIIARATARSGRPSRTDALRANLLSADGQTDGHTSALAFDAAADDFLAVIVNEYGAGKNGAIILPPSTIAIGKKLGTGAFGAVYHGTYQHIGVAIKELHCGLGRDYTVDRPRYVRDLLTEAAMLARARHRHLVNFLGISMGKYGRLLIIMELCQSTLRSYLDRIAKNTIDGEFSRPQETLYSAQLRGCIELTLGLEYLHSVLNVVHRDIKIDNIFVSFKGRVKLGDLGTACLMSGLAEATVAGTPLYLAPEALNCASWNEPGYGDRLDIFATSITICEIFTNCTPYEELLHKFSKAQELYDAVAEGLRPSTYGIPAVIAAVCHDCWAFFPAERPTASELVSRLKEIRSIEEWNEIRITVESGGVPIVRV